MRALKILLLVCCLIASGFGQAGSPKESLLIGPGDQLHIQVFETPDLEQHPRVTDAGDVPLMLLGNVHVAGMTPAQAAALIQQKLIEGKFMFHPQVTVAVDQYATQSVAVLGQVKNPGSYPITAPRTVIDMIAMAGGLTDVAERKITIERQSDPARNVDYFLSNNSNDALKDNVMVNPGDKVLVPKAGLVYVLGDVKNPGAYVMSNNSSQLTVLQMVAAAGGTNHSAVPSHARLMRAQADGTHDDGPLPLSAMQKGKQPDLPLHPGDIVYVPFSYFRNLALQSSSIVGSTSAAAIYTLP